LVSFAASRRRPRRNEFQPDVQQFHAGTSDRSIACMVLCPGGGPHFGRQTSEQQRHRLQRLADIVAGGGKEFGFGGGGGFGAVAGGPQFGGALRYSLSRRSAARIRSVISVCVPATRKCPPSASRNAMPRDMIQRQLPS